MELKVLIAVPSDIFRAGLRTVLTEDKHIVQVHEAATKEEIPNSTSFHKSRLHCNRPIACHRYGISPTWTFYCLSC